MTIYQMVFALFAASLPIIVVAVIVRHVVSVFRSLKLRRFKSASISVVAISVILLFFAGVAVIWFGYGVGHSGKGVWDELMLFAVSAVPIYGGGYGLWRLARFLDARSDANAV